MHAGIPRRPSVLPPRRGRDAAELHPEPALYGLHAAFDSDDDVFEVRRGDQVLHRGPAGVDGPVDVDLYGLRTVHADTVRDPAWAELFSELLAPGVRLLRARDAA